MRILWRLLTANDEENQGVKAVSNGDLARSSEELARSKAEKARSKMELLLAFCAEPRNLSEISEYLGMKEKYKMKKKFIDPLLGVSLQMTEPDAPNSPTQKYVTIKR